MGKLIVELPDELHTQLKQHATATHKTLKVIVTSLLAQYIRNPGRPSSKTTTGLCGVWRDQRSAEALIAQLRSARRWQLGGR